MGAGGCLVDPDGLSSGVRAPHVCERGPTGEAARSTRPTPNTPGSPLASLTTRDYPRASPIDPHTGESWGGGPSGDAGWVGVNFLRSSQHWHHVESIHWLSRKGQCHLGPVRFQRSPPENSSSPNHRGGVKIHGPQDAPLPAWGEASLTGEGGREAPPGRGQGAHATPI